MKPTVQIYVKNTYGQFNHTLFKAVYEYINNQEKSPDPTIVTPEGLPAYLKALKNGYQSLGFSVTVTEVEDDEE